MPSWLMEIPPWSASFLLFAAHGGSARVDRFDDVVVAGAPAEVAFEIFADLLLVGRGIVLHEVERAHHHAGRAEAALQTVVFAEGFLHRVQLTVRGHAF